MKEIIQLGCKSFRARGRNGWFKAKEIEVETAPEEGAVVVQVYSQRRGKDAPISLTLMRNDARKFHKSLGRSLDELNSMEYSGPPVLITTDIGSPGVISEVIEASLQLAVEDAIKLFREVIGDKDVDDNEPLGEEGEHTFHLFMWHGMEWQKVDATDTIDGLQSWVEEYA